VLRRLADLGLYLLIAGGVVALIGLLAVGARNRPTVWFAVDTTFLVVVVGIYGWLALRHYRGRRISNLVLAACGMAMSLLLFSPGEPSIPFLLCWILIIPVCRGGTQPIAMVVLGVLATLLVFGGSSTMVKELFTGDGALWMRWLGVFLLFAMIPYDLWVRRADEQLGQRDI
jgi:hypothetical protein